MIKQCYLTCLPHIFCLLVYFSPLQNYQGRSEGTSSVAFEVLIIKSEIDFINRLIFNCLTSNINLLIFNCLTLNINLFKFNRLTSNFCFFFKFSYFSQAEENGCLWMRVLSFGFSTQPGKWWFVIFEMYINFWGTAPRARTY